MTSVVVGEILHSRPEHLYPGIILVYQCVVRVFLQSFHSNLWLPTYPRLQLLPGQQVQHCTRHYLQQASSDCFYLFITLCQPDLPHFGSVVSPVLILQRHGVSLLVHLDVDGNPVTEHHAPAASRSSESLRVHLLQVVDDPHLSSIYSDKVLTPGVTLTKQAFPDVRSKGYNQDLLAPEAGSHQLPDPLVPGQVLA